MPMVAQLLHKLPTITILFFFVRTATIWWSIFRRSGSLRHGCVTDGILHCNMLIGLEAKLNQNPPYLEHQFLHQWRYCTDCIFEKANFFNGKKGSQPKI
jgi:hypothetical protein